MAEIILILLVVLLIRGLLSRNMPRVGGKIGARRALDPPELVPEGFSRVETRAATVFTAASDGASFPTLRAFLRHGTTQHPTLMRVYRVAGCRTEIELPLEPANYDRISATEALALLRELPDPRLVRRLHLSDEASFLDPWVRHITRQDFFLLGNATSTGLVVLYRPDRRHLRSVGLTLLHEWLHLVAFKSRSAVHRFRRANVVAPLAPPMVEPVSFGSGGTAIHEAWSDLGEKLLGYEDTLARDAALTSPLHATILWQRVETSLRKAPPRWRSTRFEELQKRSTFMRNIVAPRARKTADWR